MVDHYFFHGFASDSAVWRRYREFFPSARFFDLKSSVSGNLDLPTPQRETIITGWSMGAMAALKIVENYPEKIVGIVSLSSSPAYMKCDIFDDGKKEEQVGLLKNALENNFNAAVAKFQRELFTKDEIKNGMLANFRREIAPHIKTEKDQILNMLKFIENYRPNLNKLKAIQNLPVIVLHAKDDAVVNVNAVNVWKNIFQNTEIHLFEGGHALPFVHFEKVVELIKKFEQKICVNL